MAIEVTTEAIVLGKEDIGEQDSRVFLYTKDFGKLAAKATSLRKIISKLAAHLEFLNYSTVRLVSKGDFFSGNNFHITDALLIESIGDLRHDPDWLQKIIPVFDLLSKSVPEGAKDEELWNFLKALRKKEINPDLSEALRILGFDPSFASCELCQASQPEYFFAKNNFFICRSCVPADGKQLVKLI